MEKQNAKRNDDNNSIIYLPLHISGPTPFSFKYNYDVAVQAKKNRLILQSVDPIKHFWSKRLLAETIFLIDGYIYIQDNTTRQR